MNIFQINFALPKVKVLNTNMHYNIYNFQVEFLNLKIDLLRFTFTYFTVSDLF